MSETTSPRPASPFDGKAFDVENALLMYAGSYATMPAEGMVACSRRTRHRYARPGDRDRAANGHTRERTRPG
jgi:hypothetical protein